MNILKGNASGCVFSDNQPKSLYFHRCFAAFWSGHIIGTLYIQNMCSA